jgi:hypothetical protein
MCEALYACLPGALMGFYGMASLVCMGSACVVPRGCHWGYTPVGWDGVCVGYLRLGAFWALALLLWALSYEPRVRCTCFGLSNVISYVDGWGSGGERRVET